VAVSTFRHGGRGKRLPEVLTEPELARLLRQANRRSPTGARNLAMLLCMGRCGLRVGEVTSLQLKDVTQDAIHVWRGKGAKDRVVPLDMQTGQAIEAWLAVRQRLEIRTRTLFTTITTREEGEATGLKCGPVSAATEPGKSVDPRYVRQMVARYATRAGLEKDVHPHTLRHTAATTWLRAGFNLREVQKLLGHSSPATTEIYTHVFDEDLQRKQKALLPLDL
jgi:integrase/recombinase XerD